MEKDNGSPPEKENDTSADRKTPALELLAAALGFLLVAGTIGFLFYDALTEADSPPEIVVEKKEIIKQSNGFLVKFEIENKGDNHASEVTVEGKLSEGGQEKETSSVGIAYAPSHSKRQGGIFFTDDPNKFELKLRVLGYTEP